VIDAVLATLLLGNSEYDVEGLRFGKPLDGVAIGNSTGSGARGIDIVWNTPVDPEGCGLYP
jgi:hypothetical protein